MERYFWKGHNLYIDNLYKSLRLANYLIEDNTNVIGTIRENRKHFLLELKNTFLQKGGATVCKHDSIVIVVILYSFGIDLNIIYLTKCLSSDTSRIFDIAKYYIFLLLP